MDKLPIKVCMISCLHGLYDDRIYWKEALSLKKNGYEVVHLGISEEAFDKLSDEGIRLISIQRKRYYKNPYFDKLFRLLTFKPNYYNQLLKIASELKSDVYHFHDYQINRIGKQLKNLPNKPKVIYDVHEPYPVTLATTTSKNPLAKIFWRFYGHYVEYWEKAKSVNYDLIITTEENVQGVFKEKLPGSLVEIIYNYVDIEPIECSKPKRYDFIYSGGIRKRRGIFEILNSVKMLNDKGVKSKTLIIGHIHDPGLEQEINSFIDKHNLNESIEIKQVVPYQKIHEFYETSKIGLAIFNDERVNRIIMPIKIFEYIVFGLPVITSNFGHMREVTLKNSTGILVNPSNVVELAVSMIKLLSDDKLYNELTANCINSAKRDYTWKIMENKLIQLYNNLMAN